MCVLICLWEPIQGDAHKSEWRDLNGDTNSLQSTVTNASSWWHHAVILAFRFTFMHLLKQTPPLATGRHFFISELLAPPALCLSSIRCRQENHMQWAGLGVWLQDLQDWRTCRTEVRHHSVTTAGLRGSSRLCSLQPRAGALSFLCSFCM